MNNNLLNIKNENKNFMKSISILFRYVYDKEIKKYKDYQSHYFNIEKAITKEIENKLKEYKLDNFLEIRIRTVYGNDFEVFVKDNNKQEWFFEIPYNNFKLIKLISLKKELDKGIDDCFVYNDYKYNYLLIRYLGEVEKLNLKEDCLTEENINILNLKYDINMVFFNYIKSISKEYNEAFIRKNKI